MSATVFNNNLKTLGLLQVSKEQTEIINGPAYKEYIKILYLPAGYKLRVDFACYHTQQPTLFFISPNQYLELEIAGQESGYFIFYNRDFYCIQIHDQEVACDGLLFNNIRNMPKVELLENEIAFLGGLFKEMIGEFQLNDSSLEEMMRTYLKQLLIRATRSWKRQHLTHDVTDQQSDLEFFRKFTRLVEQHYKSKHTVADYADFLCMAPKTITHKFNRLRLPQPNEVIKNRIILEAKRLLVHTSLTAKEIAYELGYSDPAYFSRLFQTKTGESPSSFRVNF
ncbi:AraC-like DNA-binding protein [Dyadobacter sp. BE34]|uniref:AraC-like DNA-binding protein n=1 Tax=Dyadobacter fermentans TaxID=94254 RepID=A0ABU1QZ98_9BACT|nr:MULTISPECIES: helix-turn-helix domain-containing protein [Dyadobacter]MDR6806004.1 AraC-like DNA-binding protein [Dyadobacter fermentans]MDR7043745.1 AraC-like DNA-binding protein [Dyadobacter sp. BE242]MDR7198057.1 AraC-like DNA-binding protein [Dyadobacter sp. BE34]MDR7216019.1 AraC-like DNA-binding protein [Dyadobacter sp. BE31]MDR7264455.1 AraC-like DNA-binding protein [Dyadobacter sp. BE32]